MRNDDFNFHVPINVIEKAGEDGQAEMILAGIASTADKDRQGEELIPDGFDFSYLQNHGYINWHHQLSKDPSAVIGEPTKVELRKGQGLYLEARLYPDSEMAQKAYSLAKVLTNNSTKRKLGWSIEGKVVERDPKNPSKVLKSKITGCALTPMPINANTFVNILKGFESVDEIMAEEAEQGKGNGGETKVLEKSVYLDGQEIMIQKDMSGDILINVRKSLNTESGRPVIPESVEGGTKPKDGYPPKMKEGQKNLEKGFTMAEAYEYLFAAYPDMSPSEAKEVMRIAQKNKAL